MERDWSAIGARLECSPEIGPSASEDLEPIKNFANLLMQLWILTLNKSILLLIIPRGVTNIGLGDPRV